MKVLTETPVLEAEDDVAGSHRQHASGSSCIAYSTTTVGGVGGALPIAPERA